MESHRFPASGSGPGPDRLWLGSEGIYLDGPAAYFTFGGLGNKPALVEQFWTIKKAASDALMKAGGTITHHHAVGLDHRQWYDQERPEVFATALGAVKSTLDPKWLLNPGVLIDPQRASPAR